MSRRRRVLGWVAIAVVALVSAVWIALLSPLPADPDAARLAESERIECDEPCDLAFGSTSADIGVVLYVGARVEPAAYADLAVAIADAGYFAAVPDLTLNFAVFDQDAALDVIDAHPDVDRWVVGGHSLGGAMAARVATRDDRIVGLVFLAAYPEADLDLTDSGIEVLSISATEDGLATPAEVRASFDQLPDDTDIVEIEGGNHAQFGDYGPQRSDGVATISGDEQREMIERAVIDFLDDLG